MPFKLTLYSCLGNIIRRDDDDDALFPIESIINGEYINASVTQLEAFSPRVQGMRKSQTRVYTLPRSTMNWPDCSGPKQILDWKSL